jgi:hypothetical protein
VIHQKVISHASDMRSDFLGDELVTMSSEINVGSISLVAIWPICPKSHQGKLVTFEWRISASVYARELSSHSPTRDIEHACVRSDSSTLVIDVATCHLRMARIANLELTGGPIIIPLGNAAGRMCAKNNRWSACQVITARMKDHMSWQFVCG